MKYVARWLAMAAVVSVFAGCGDKKSETPAQYAPPPGGTKAGGLRGGEPPSAPSLPR
ncbi:MAG TPA: hypothetical protein VKD71_03130 [Gemmataceae bacterium]|nr:hypothetical protein [Gemmataceae bacterium]